mmetsp:Transcript_1103/g.7115  ORF Transcript_1103/g.7115 Transcript_1103/m.7115 type:complete len:242 (-) Transcript_1103:133-858(-)
MSLACPLAAPDGEWSMILVCGKQYRFPFAPLDSRNPPMANAPPKPTVPTSLRQCFMVSWMDKDGTTSPPGQFTYTFMSLLFSESRYSMVPTIWFPNSSSMFCPKKMILSRYNTFHMSTHWYPPSPGVRYGTLGTPTALVRTDRVRFVRVHEGVDVVRASCVGRTRMASLSFAWLATRPVGFAQVTDVRSAGQRIDRPFAFPLHRPFVPVDERTVGSWCPCRSSTCRSRRGGWMDRRTSTFS